VSEPKDQSVSKPAASRPESSATPQGPDADTAAALSYRSGRDLAPKVVAKGKGEIARKIVEVARASGVPVRQDADLAALLAAVDLDTEIPVEAFAAVAEILAYIYRANRELPGGADETTEPAKDEP